MHGGWIALITIGVIILLVILVILYSKLTTGWNKSRTDLYGKTAIVTGANTGIGFYTAQDLAKRGAKVILACRDPIRAEEAKTKIMQATGNPNVLVRIVDFASLSSVRQFATEIKATEERLNILVNNAGAVNLEHSHTSDGLSLLMQINHFGPFLLTVLLIDLLKKSASSRIVNVSSTAAFSANLNINDLNALPASMFPKLTEYSNTKLCNILFTNELARKLKATGVVANSLHPGVVKTEITRNFGGVTAAIYGALGSIFIKTAEAGAQTTIYLAVSKEVDGVSGEYFSDCKKKSMPKTAKDEELARKLWEKSEEFVKLTPEEKLLI